MNSSPRPTAGDSPPSPPLVRREIERAMAMGRHRKSVMRASRLLVESRWATPDQEIRPCRTRPHATPNPHRRGPFPTPTHSAPTRPTSATTTRRGARAVPEGAPPSTPVEPLEDDDIAPDEG